jgi:hypothetical protein
MRCAMLFTLVVLFPLALVGRSAAQEIDPKNPNAIIAKAIVAHGGKDQLEKYKASKSCHSGVITLGGAEMEFTEDTVFQWPDRMKATVKLELMGTAMSIEQKLVGDKFTLTLNGMTIDVPDLQKAEVKSAMIQTRATQLTPLLEKGFELKTIPGVKVGDQETVGVAVTCKDMKECKLYFDTSSYLLVKFERLGLDPTGTEEAKHETFLSDYKDAQGIKSPRRMVIMVDGQKYMETTVTEHKFLEKVDDKEFSD